jgi:integrase
MLSIFQEPVRQPRQPCQPLGRYVRVDDQQRAVADFRRLLQPSLPIQAGHERCGVTWPNGVPTIGTQKSMAGIRDVHIPPHLIAAVSAHLEWHTDPSPDGLLFRGVRGGNMHPRTFGKLYDKAPKEVGRPDLRFHDLRHRGAVMAARAGATLAELQARLGHSTATAAMR